MEKKIKIKIGESAFSGRLNDTRIAELIWEALPLTAAFQFWGDEIYFPIPVKENRMEKPRERVDVGDLGYWPDGNCFCIFYGLTPVSSPGNIRPASAVEVIGRVENHEGFKQVKGTGKITVAKDE